MFKRVLLWGWICLVVLAGMHLSAAQAAGPLAAADAADNPCAVISCTVFLPTLRNSVAPAAPKFEVTQGVQQPNNAVRLIAQRPTYTRWTLTTPAATTNVNGYLVGSRNGVPLAGSPLAALNNPRTVPTTVNRAILNDTFNFQLPADWLDGTISLSAYALNTGGFFTHTAAYNITFQPTAALNVTVVPIQYQCSSGGSGTTTPIGPYNYLVDYTFRTYPVPAINVTTHAPVPYAGRCNSSGVPLPWSSADPDNFTDWENMLDLVTTVWIAEGRPNSYYYGLLHLDCGGGCVAGLGWIGGYQAAVGFDGFGTAHSGASDTHAHEVGHNHGSRHAPGCGAGGATPFPYVPADGKARIGDDAHPNYGFDLTSKAIYVYATTYDIMNYCDPQWVSDYTYDQWWQYDNNLQALANPIGSRAFLISGRIDVAAQRATFDPVYALDLSGRVPDRGDYTLELRDQHGRVLATQPFEVVTAQPDQIGGSTAPATLGFHLTVPYIDGVAELRVRHGTIVLGTQRVQPSAAPSNAPQNRGGQLSWSGVAGAHYLVRASNDNGRTWEVIGLDLTQPRLDLSATRFTDQRARFEVITALAP